MREEKAIVTQAPDNPAAFGAVVRRIEPEFAVRSRAFQPPEPPEYGEAEAAPPPPSFSLQLPLSTPRAAYILLAINVLIYALTGLLSLLATGSLLAFFQPTAGVLSLGWKSNVLILNGEYWRFLTAMFLHGNLVHLFFNGYALFILGPETERIFGTPRFLAIYFLSGLAGGVASYAMSPSPSVGASGAIFGLIGALAVFFYLARDILGDMGRRQLQAMVFIIVINLLIGFSAGGVIDNYAHVGGLIGGALAGLVLAPRFQLDQRLYPPVVLRTFDMRGWVVVTVLFLLLALAAFVIVPPLPPPR